MTQARCGAPWAGAWLPLGRVSSSRKPSCPSPRLGQAPALGPPLHPQPCPPHPTVCAISPLSWNVNSWRTCPDTSVKCTARTDLDIYSTVFFVLFFSPTVLIEHLLYPRPGVGSRDTVSNKIDKSPSSGTDSLVPGVTVLSNSLLPTGWHRLEKNG